MAECEFCKREMLKADGCTFTHIRTKDGKLVRRQTVGDEGWYSPGERCGDCGALFGYYHHPGCDVERCPVCGQQMISCFCDYDTLCVVKE